MAGVIRAGKPAKPEQFSLQDVERTARSILARAERDAAEILAAAERRAQQDFAREYSRGYDAGSEQGREDGRKQACDAASAEALKEARAALTRLGQSLSSGLSAFQAEKNRLLASAETGLVELAIAVARRVCKTQAAQSSEAAVENARRLIDLARHEHDLELLISPAEFALLQHALPELLHTLGSNVHVKLRADESVSPGGCRVRGRHGTLDATLETQIERVAEAILPARAHPHAEPGT